MTAGLLILRLRLHAPLLCGSLLTLDVKQDSGTILALGYKARACTLGMASAAIVIEKLPAYLLVS